MKTKLCIPRVCCCLFVAGSMFFASNLSVRAATGTWTNDFDSIWSDSTNWLNGVVADGSGSSAIFSNELSSVVGVSLDSPRTLGSLQFLQGVYTVTNNGVDANILTLAGPAKPLINVPGGQTATIRRTVLAGSDGFMVDGGGTLALFKENTDSNNVVSGSVVLNGGSTIMVQGLTADNDNDANTLALNSVSTFIFTNGTLNLRPAPNTSPQYGNVNGNLVVPADATGTLILPVRWLGASGDNAGSPGAGLGGSLTGSGTFNVETKYVRGNVVGDWSAFSGQLNLTANATGGGDEFRFGSIAGLPSASVDLGGTAAFTFRYYPAITSNTVFRIGQLSGNNAGAFVAGSASAAFTLVYAVGSKMTNASDTVTFAGNFVNGAGPAALIKEGAGTWVLSGTNTYTGFTTISNGLLQIGDGSTESGSLGTGPVTNLTSLIFARSGSVVISAPIRETGSVSNVGPGTVTLTGSNTYSGGTFITGGRLVLGTLSKLTGNVTVSDSAGLGALYASAGSTLTVGGIAFGSGSTFDIDLSSLANPSGTVASNTGALTLNGNVAVNITGAGISVGTVTLLRYGSRSGTGSFVLGTLPDYVTAATLNDDTVNKQVTLTVTTVVDRTLRWVGDAAGAWDIDNAANKIWREVSSGILTNYYDGAKVRFDDSATGTNTIDVTTTVSPASVIVDNSTLQYTFGGAGQIGGAAILRKLGSNKLVIANQNAYTGGTAIEAGSVEVFDGATLTPLGTGPVTNDAAIVLNNAEVFTLPNVISGSGSVRQIGLGTATISGNNSYSGGLTVTPGTSVGYNNGNAGGVGGGITIDQGTLVLGSDVATSVGTITVLSNAAFTASANRVINPRFSGTNVVLTFDKTALITLNGDIQAVTGVVSNQNTGGLRFNSGGANGCTGSSNMLFVLTAGSFLQNRNGGIIDLGAVEGAGTIGSPQNANNATVNFRIGLLNTSTIFNGIINDNNTNANNRLTGIIKAGTGTLTMENATLTYFGPTAVSNGVLALTGSSGLSNSTSVTVVSPGILNVSGRDAGTLYLGQPNELQAGRVQTLRGNGTIQGSVVLGTTARLEPGPAAAAIGTLTASGSVVLGGTTLMEVTTAGSPASDRLAAANIAYGGTLVLTNIGNLTGTNTFQLFSGAISQSFANVVTPTLSGVTWDLSQLNANGSITVVGPAGPSTAPTNITVLVAGGNLTLSWPADHIGWRLQTQTNSLSVGLTNNWVEVAGSSATDQVTIPIGNTNGAVFFRLVFP